MKKEIIITADGSSTIYLPKWDENYHSKHGAIKEAYHVFIKNGLDLFKNNSKVCVLEVGFGTGLNCFISYLESIKRKLVIDYEGVEGYPLQAEEILELNYINELKAEKFKLDFDKIHSKAWGSKIKLGSKFNLLKRKHFFEEIKDKDRFNLIYFDAFGARVQPELWTEEIFAKMYVALKNNGILVTYSAKGSVRRAMQAVGFEVERLPGPPGKREMLRARKNE